MAAGIPRRIPRLIRSRSTLTNSRMNPTAENSPASDILDLGDTERLFSSSPTGSLVRSLAVLRAMASDPAVDLAMAAMRSPAVMRSPAAVAAARATVYGHFCAGEVAAEAATTLRGIWAAGMKGILDYGVEDAGDNDACDRNLHGFLSTVDMTSSLPPSSVSFACMKITAICPISLLERVSDLLRWKQKHPSFHLPWKSQSLPVLSDSSPLYHTPSMPPPLTETEELDLRTARQRLSTLCQRCVDFDLPLLVDAEYTSVQPAIDHLTYSAAMEFNQRDRPIVYGTIQAYLRDSKERMALVMEAAERERVSMGLKLVRGAYLTRETQLATSLGVKSPIHESITETHQCYDDCAVFMLQRVVQGSGSVVLATHNLESGKAAAAKATELGIAKGDPKLHFAQLKGMADGLSLGLRNAGFQVSKYLPFGPVEQVIPYLLRRAEENRGFLSASTLDRELIRNELKRRLKAAVLGKDQ